jgi:hypothetical protein
MTKFTVWILAFSFVQPVFARTAVLAPGADAVEFHGWLTTQSGVRAASGDFSLPNKEKERFNKLLASAQKNFLNGSLAQAKERFRALTELAHSQDWPRAQQRALQFSFLRLAQLSSTDQERHRWLDEAIAFAGETKPDATLFPPPLLTEYKKRLEAKSDLEMKVDSRFEGYSAITVDGKVFNTATTDLISILPGKHRLTLRSDSFATETIVEDAQELVHYVPKRKEFVRGSCETPLAGETRNAIVYYDRDCQYSFTNGRFERLGIQAAQTQAWKDFAVAKPTELSFPETPRAKRPLLKSPWLWIGVAVAGAVIVARSQQTETTVTPSSRVGY